MPAKRARSADGPDAAAVVAKKGGKKEAAPSAAGGECPNEPVCRVFEDLMLYESKDGNKWAGVAYQKVVTTLRSLKTAIKSGNEIAHMQGIGKASVDKINEFLSTGTVKKLDDLKALHGALPSGMVLPTKSGGGAGATTAKGKAAAAAAAGATIVSKAQLTAIKKAAEEFDACSMQALKDLCKLNKQIMAGTKGDLVQRCAEGKVLGQIPVCPFCGAGKLRYDIKTGMYKCPGYTDDDQYKPCVFQSGQVARSPWQDSA